MWHKYTQGGYGHTGSVKSGGLLVPGQTRHGGELAGVKKLRCLWNGCLGPDVQGP